jgi:hypothetical protein
MSDARISRPLRFVVLRHAVGSESKGPSLQHGAIHLDWMFEVGQSLLTWSTVDVADVSLEAELEATKLPEHRIAYLEKQGDVGGDRGTVLRIAEGQLSNVQLSENTFCAELTWVQPTGKDSASRITIQRISDASWRLRLDRGL